MQTARFTAAQLFSLATAPDGREPPMHRASPSTLLRFVCILMYKDSFHLTPPERKTYGLDRRLGDWGRRIFRRRHAARVDSEILAGWRFRTVVNGSRKRSWRRR